jgi:FixJ family two-component response regulator
MVDLRLTPDEVLLSMAIFIMTGLLSALVPARRAAAIPPWARRERCDDAAGDAMKVLIADDQPAVCAALQLLFELHGLPSGRRQPPEEALDLIATEDIGAVVQDMNFTQEKTSGEEGVALFRAIKKLDADLPVVLLTAWSSLETAVSLVKEGASDYMAKPWDDDKLARVVKNLVQMRALQQENTRLNAQRSRLRKTLASALRPARAGLRQRGDARRRQPGLHDRRPPTRPVLITGPERLGQGEAGRDRPGELAPQGQAVREDQRRRAARRSAGGRAVRRRGGRVHGAEQVAHRPLRGGARRNAVPRRDRQPVAGRARPSCCACCRQASSSGSGPAARRKADVRIISATNTDLPRAIAAGHFREDLYFRLNVIELPLPPLGERPDDVLLLAEHFLERCPASTARRREAVRRGAPDAAAVRVAGQRARAAEPDPPRQADRRRRRHPAEHLGIPPAARACGRVRVARRRDHAAGGRADAGGRARRAATRRRAPADPERATSRRRC